jgi:high potential iron-sulfur protein
MSRLTASGTSATSGMAASGTATRRTLLKSLAVAAAAAALVPIRRVAAADSPHLDVKDPAAVAVGYVETAAQVDLKKYPAYIKGSTCENCLLLQGSSGPHYRPCNLFPGKSVSVDGWCSGWSAEI